MNLFFVFGSGPDARSGDAVAVRLAAAGHHPRLAARAGRRRRLRRRGAQDQHRRVAREGRIREITEVFACGTAAVITPVGRVKSAEGEFTSPTASRARSRWRCATPLGINAAPSGHPRWMTKLR